MNFAQLRDRAPDAIVTIDVDGRITLVNAQTERLFGYDRNELIGRSVEILVPPDAGQVHPGDRRCPLDAELQLVVCHRDGTRFPAEISLSTTDSPDGDGCVTAAIRDATDRKRTEATFHGLFESAPDAIVGVDVDGVIAVVNAQTEQLFGYVRSELVGQPLELLVPFDVSTPDSPDCVGTEVKGRRKDGSEFSAEINLSAFEVEDAVLISAAVRDVTDRVGGRARRELARASAEREQIESRLHQAQRLESLGQLTGGVAHDFNNLIGVIVNYTSFIADEVRAAADEPGGQRWRPVADDIEQVQRAAYRASQLTNQLLVFARREVERPTVLDLNEVIDGIEPFIRRTLGDDIELVVMLQPNVWPVSADAGQVEQVLVNLAANARDAMRAGGTLTVETGNVIVDSDAAVQGELKPGRHVRLCVSDSGAGMEPEVLARAFEPFFSTKPRGEGSGLGLATVHDIVSRAGGRPSLYSVSGFGTTFTAVLPAVDGINERIENAKKPYSAAPAGPSSRGSGSRTRAFSVADDMGATRT